VYGNDSCSTRELHQFNFQSVIIGGQVGQVCVIHLQIRGIDLQNNLFSALYLTQHRGFNVHISKSIMKFEKNGHIPFVAKVGDELLMLVILLERPL
jgi:hypothetical protein